MKFPFKIVRQSSEDEFRKRLADLEFKVMMLEGSMNLLRPSKSPRQNYQKFHVVTIIERILSHLSLDIQQVPAQAATITLKAVATPSDK